MSPEQCNRLFDRMGDVLRDAFSFARQLGVKTCLGTETPLVIPDAVKQRLKAEGKNPSDPAVVQALYEGIFQRIAKTHPADYYWLWTPEGWTWSGCSEAEIKATQADFRAALAAMEKVKPPFTLATCGWVLGPPQTPALFDDTLPKNMPMSCISRTVGNSPVEPGFRRVTGRPKWSIPWMEDDPGLTMPQLWAGRMRRDAADSLAYGCTGLMGIHWRTRILGPNVSALAQAAWDQRGWNPTLARSPTLRGQFSGRVDGGAARGVPRQQDRRHAGCAALPDGPLQHERLSPQGAQRRLYGDLEVLRTGLQGQGQRVFGVKVQGQPLVKGLDIFARVGQNHALDLDHERRSGDQWPAYDRLRSTKSSSPASPRLRSRARPTVPIRFPASPYSRKINCGGPAYKDYEADLSGGSEQPRYLPTDDFYADWARAQFGPQASDAIAAIFVRLDGHLPRPADWVTGPGSIRPDSTAWQSVQKHLTPLSTNWPHCGRASSGQGTSSGLTTGSIISATCGPSARSVAYGPVSPRRWRKSARKRTRNCASNWPAKSHCPSAKSLWRPFGEMHGHLLATVTQCGRVGQRLQLAAADCAGHADRARPGVGRAVWASRCRPTPSLPGNMPGRRGSSCRRSEPASWRAKRSN